MFEVKIYPYSEIVRKIQAKSKACLVPHYIKCLEIDLMLVIFGLERKEACIMKRLIMPVVSIFQV